jgi:hypothetical protein
MYIAERDSELELLVIDPPKLLVLEQPLWVRCQLINFSNRPMNISLRTD